MTLARDCRVPLKHPDRFFIGGGWVQPSSSALLDVLDSHSEEVFLSVAEAQAPDMDRAVTAAREAFDTGPWPRMSHLERAVAVQFGSTIVPTPSRALRVHARPKPTVPNFPSGSVWQLAAPVQRRGDCTSHSADESSTRVSASRW